MFKKKVTAILLSTFIIISTLAFSQGTVSAAGINGWQKTETTWNYYLNGNKATNWVLDKGKWYYLDSNGDMVTGRVTDNNKVYFLNNNGDMATSWVLTDGKWYYFNKYGDMATGWLLYKSKWYYLNSVGDMAVSTATPDGYLIGSDGVWTGNKIHAAGFDTSLRNSLFTAIDGYTAPNRLGWFSPLRDEQLYTNSVMQLKVDEEAKVEGSGGPWLGYKFTQSSTGDIFTLNKATVKRIVTDKNTASSILTVLVQQNVFTTGINNGDCSVYYDSKLQKNVIVVLIYNYIRSSTQKPY